MFRSNIKKNPKKAEKISHIFFSLIVLVTAYDKYDRGESSFIFFAAAGIIFLLVAIFHARIVKNFSWTENIFTFLEGIISFIIAYDYYNIGKSALPFAYLLVGIMQFLVGIVKTKKQLKLDKSKN